MLLFTSRVEHGHLSGAGALKQQAQINVSLLELEGNQKKRSLVNGTPGNLRSSWSTVTVYVQLTINNPRVILLILLGAPPLPQCPPLPSWMTTISARHGPWAEDPLSRELSPTHLHMTPQKPKTCSCKERITNSYYLLSA